MSAAELPRLIFTISTGRCGTDFLSKMLGRLDSVHCEHEPEPDFSEVMREAQCNPQLALEFLRDKKLPAIQATGAKTYIETSHLFGKGFFEPLFELGFLPDAIFLSRDNRDVAKSLLRIGTIPERSDMGKKYLLSPDDPGVESAENWNSLTDYQLCYWYTLETARRAECYREFLRRFDKLIPRTTLEKLRTWQGFRDLAYALNLKRPPRLSWLAWRQRLRQSTNKKEHFKGPTESPSVDSLSQQEEEVRKRIETARQSRCSQERLQLRSMLAGKNIELDALPHKQAADDLRNEYEAYLRDVSTPDMAVSLELASFMLALCRIRQPDRVLDLGSGFSSYVLRKYVAERGQGEVYSVDDDSLWLERTASWLKSHELSAENLYEWEKFKRDSEEIGPFDLVLYDMGSMATRISELRFVLSNTANADSLVILDDVHKADYDQFARYVCRTMNLKWADASEVSLDRIKRHSAIVSHA